MDRGDLLKDNTKNDGTNKDMGTCIILDFNLQHNEVERIIHRYWNVLKQDAHLKGSLSETPRIVYKRAPNLHDRLVKHRLLSQRYSGTVFTAVDGVTAV